MSLSDIHGDLVDWEDEPGQWEGPIAELDNNSTVPITHNVAVIGNVDNGVGEEGWAEHAQVGSAISHLALHKYIAVQVDEERYYGAWEVQLGFLGIIHEEYIQLTLLEGCLEAPRPINNLNDSVLQNGIGSAGWIFGVQCKLAEDSVICCQYYCIPLQLIIVGSGRWRRWRRSRTTTNRGQDVEGIGIHCMEDIGNAVQYCLVGVGCIPHKYLIPICAST